MEMTRVNGIRLAYDRLGVGAPLLLLHGFPLDHSTWSPLATCLGANFDLIMPDLPGFGQSGLPESEYSFEEVASDLAELLDQLNIQKTYIAGHSMGGYVALAFAHIYPTRVIGLALIGSQALPDTPERKASRYHTAGQVALIGCEAVVEMAKNLSASPQFVPFFREVILRQQPAGLIYALKAMAARPNAIKFFKFFKFPVALVHGLADGLIPPERAREIKSLLPQAILTELPGVGHAPMLEAPEQTALALLMMKKQVGF